MYIFVHFYIRGGLMSDILKAPVYEGRPKLGEGRLEKEIRT